ncbi:SIS domain-containing protein [Roseobacter sinensis]|uniref:SIS domain-containing protein n=1 Tax=Roseobacter sinensis TaxID=2931391 RepID=A0ABT3BL50_9RHOB|nr:SIS domain-containing protein [Roseobacter sp. WL0113]MCV3274089.1 SIS domain-containing protein [Roseobacter sp. WL0113]
MVAETPTDLADRLLDELRPGLAPEVLAQIEPLSDRLARAQRIACHGVGREGLMMKALAMRLFHLGCDAHVVGDMTTPPVGDGDVLIVSAGPGQFSTIAALAGVAQEAGAEVICLTAEPAGAVPRAADHVVHVPAQTMAADQGAAATSILPMGSLYEALMFLFCELLVLDLRDRLDVAPDAMRANHTNLE